VIAASTLTFDDLRATSRLSSPQSDARDRAFVAAAAASAKNGEDIVVLDVGEIISIIDEFVLVSASNTRLVRTICDEVKHALDAHDGSRPIGVEGLDDATWVLLDYGDIVVHIFLQETREYYDLDRLWADAGRTEVAEPSAVAADG
jgi:ribosome-associated protein